MSVEDRAQDIELLDWERNNRPRAERRRFAPGEEGYGPAQCVECEDDMPAERRAMGSHICTACKTLQEQQQKRRAA